MTDETRIFSRRVARVLFIALLGVVLGIPGGVTLLNGADHREAPLIDEDPVADLADVYAFVSPTDPTKVVFGLTVNSFATPAVRGTYSFGPDVLYQIKIDNTGDAKEDLVIQVTFNGYESVRDARCPAPGGGQFLTVVGPAAPVKVGTANQIVRRGPVLTGCTNAVLGPSVDGVRAWAGLADDGFVADVGQLNRILGGTQDLFRAVGAFRGRPVRADGTSGVDAFGGFNVSGLFIEVPLNLVQGRAGRQGTYLGNANTIGVWGTTNRGKIRRLNGHGDEASDGPFIQVQRAGHQVFKTVFIPVAVRDFYNSTSPADDVTNVSQYIPDALTTADNDGTGNTIAGRAAVLDAVGVTALPNGVPLLLPPSFGNSNPNLLRQVLIPDVLRLNLSLAPTDLGIATNGLQNGRRLGDDVVDIVLRLARQLADVKFPDGSGLPGSGALGSRRALDCSVFPQCPDRRVLAVLQGTDFIKPDAALLDLSDSGNDRALRAEFPFIGLPHPAPGAPGTVGFPPQQ